MGDFLRLVQTRWAVQSHRQPLRAVDSVGLEQALQEHGLASKIDHGQVKCKFCNKTVTREAVYALLKEGGDVKIICASPDCVRGLLEKWSE